MVTDKIRAEQARTLYQQLPGIIILPNIGGVIMVAMHQDVVPLNQLGSWLAANVLVLGFGFYLLRRQYLHRLGHTLSVDQWLRRFVFISALSGVVWGMTPWFLFTDGAFVLQLTVMFFLFTASAVISQIMVAYPRAFAAIIAPMLLPLIVRLATLDDRLNYLLAVMTVAYLFALGYFYWNGHRSLMRSIELWFDKHTLALELEKREHSAQRENQAKTRLMAMAGHDLRQPLRAQGLFLQQLGKALHTDRQHQLLTQLEECHWDLLRLFDGLMDVCRIDSGHLQPDIKLHAIAPLCERLEKRFKYAATSKGLSLRVRRSEAMVETDILLLERMLSNLLDNALKYTQRGGVLLGFRQKGQLLRVDVVDTGNGTAVSGQASDHPSSQGGYGLGLSIVDRLADELGHQFEIDSVPGKGSRFSLYLPRREQPALVAL